MNNKYLFTAVFVLLLSACANNHIFVPAHWAREGTSPEEAVNKHESCVYDVGMNKVEPAMHVRLVEACMKAAGFRWIPAHTRPAYTQTTTPATAVAAPSTPAPPAPPPAPRTVTTEKTITNTTTQIIELKPNN